MARASFFAPLDDDTGYGVSINEELGQLAKALDPKARNLLPSLVEALGSGQESCPWKPLLVQHQLLHVFAAAHILGAMEVLDAVRSFLQADERYLVEALDGVDVSVDRSTLQIAMDYGFDKQCPMKLIHAAAIGDEVGVAKILVADDTMSDGENDQVGVPVDLRNALGRTPLHLCAIHNSAGVAEILIHSSADLEALCDPLDDECDDGECFPKHLAGVKTPLHLAAIHDSAEVAQLLLNGRANVGACVRGIKWAVTPLHDCATSNSDRAARIIGMAAAAAAVDLSEVLQSTPSKVFNDEIGPICDDETMDVDGAAQPILEFCRFLDPLNAKTGPCGSAPIHAAAEADASAVVSVLLELRAEIDLQDDQGDTPLHCAMLYGSPEALSELVLHGANIMAENNSGELPLNLMAEFGEGSDECKLPPLLTKLHFAKPMRAQELLIEAYKNQEKMAAALLHNAPLHSVARWDHPGAENAARLLIAAHANAEQVDAEGQTALTVAVQRFGPTGQVATLLRSSATH